LLGIDKVLDMRLVYYLFETLWIFSNGGTNHPGTARYRSFPIYQL